METRVTTNPLQVFRNMEKSLAVDGGHRANGCDGRWHPVGNLVNPWKQRCDQCGGTRNDPQA